MTNLIALELTPLAFNDKPLLATEHLFSVLHGLGSTKVSRRAEFTLSLEIVASREQGIRYYIYAPAEEASSIEQLINAYLPEVQVHLAPLHDRAPVHAKIMSFEQTRHYVYPLKDHSLPEIYDPIGYITSAMTKLATNEQVIFQILLRPIKLKHADKLRQKLLRNEDITADLQASSSPFVKHGLGALNKLSFALTDTVTYAYHGSSRAGQQSSQRAAADKHSIQQGLKPARALSSFEQELVSAMNMKLSQPLFQADIRVLVAAHSDVEAERRMRAVASSLSAFSVTGYQGLSGSSKHGKHQLIDFTHRIPTKRPNILSVSEIAGLYHFPNSLSTNPENMVQSLSRTLAAPLSLKNNPNFDVLIGLNEYHGSKTPIGLTAAERERHVYIIGGTGNGKTTMLQYGIVQDMEKGKGLAIIDPHGDMAENMLRHVPADRVDDVIYFNPDDIGYPIGLNLLELHEGLSDDELLQEKDLITESVISIFRKIFSDDDSGGHRVEYVLRNAIQTALTVPDATLFTIFQLLDNPTYRKKVVAKLDNDDLKNFWKHEIGKAGEMQRVKMAAGITAKIGRFLFSASAKRILEQPKSTVDFDDIINSGKILICNFSKGLIGEDTSELFGITVLAKLQLASLRRARIASADRQPFYLYVDEFQNFATASFVQMLSESRKYKLFMIMAEQSTSQQKDKDMVNIVLANTGTILSFRTGNPEDEKLMLPLFSPFLERGDIANLAPFNFFARLSATKSQEPLSGTTMLIESEGSSRVAARVIERSRSLYAAKALSPVRHTKEQVQPKLRETIMTTSSVAMPED
jgi:hypothetical protein